MFFGPSCIEPAMMDQAFPRKEEARRVALGYGDFDTVMNVVAKAVAGGPHILGEQFTTADVVIGSVLRFGMQFKLLPERSEFLAYTGRLAQRPALQRVEGQGQGARRGIRCSRSPNRIRCAARRRDADIHDSGPADPVL
jgi:glutathione S-transferase